MPHKDETMELQKLDPAEKSRIYKGYLSTDSNDN